MIKILEINKIYNMDCLKGLKLLDDNSIDCCVTSPPYWGLRDYGVEKQLGLEDTPEEYVENMVKVFREVKRVLKDDGTLWLNLGDSYTGSGKGAWKDKSRPKESYIPNTDSPQCKLPKIPTMLKRKELVGIPWRVAFALQSDGWYLRQDIIWAKPNPMPESVKDRCTKSHEYIFLFAKSPSYYFDSKAIKEPSVQGDKNIRNRDIGKLNTCPGRTKMNGLTRNDYEFRNKRSVWTVPTAKCKEAHFAVFPSKLIEPCILAGCRENGIVLDPFMGSGTTGLVAKQQNKNYIGFEMNSNYCDIANKRIYDQEAHVSLFKV